MKRPKLVSLGFAVPPKAYSQREVFDALQYPRHFWPIFSKAGIDKRHFWLPLGPETSWQEQCEEYARGALALSLQAVRECLDGRDPREIGCIVYGSCTGYCCPSVDYLIAKEVGLAETTRHVPVVGDGGCVGAAPVLQQAYDYTRQTGRTALAVTCELCSCAHYPERPGRPDPWGRWQLLRANAIFGDGASAALVGFDDDPKHPWIIDTECYSDTDHLDALGFAWRGGRLACVLSTEVPKLAPTVMGPCTRQLLARHGLEPVGIPWVVCHPGGKLILDNVRDTLGFTEHQFRFSREALRRWGNCSSASVGMIGSMIGGRNPGPRQGDWGLLMTVGSGISAYAILLRWP